MPLFRRVRRLALLLTLSSLGWAQAASFSGPVTVSLIAPGGATSDGGATLNSGPIDFVQSIGPAGTILPGDGTDIGGYMLSLESITLSGTSLLVQVAEGSSDGTTGYLGAGGQHARYVFDDLNVAGSTITGLTFTATDNFGAGSFVGISNLAAFTAGNGIQLSSPHSVVLALDQIHFADRGQGESNNFATFRIDLQTAPVPEPATAALAILGLAAMSMSRQLRRA